MKILQKGNPQKGWTKNYKCTGLGNGEGGCGALLQVEQDDVFQTERNFMGRDQEYYKTFKCPACGVLTDLPNGEVPFTPKLNRHQWEAKKEREEKAKEKEKYDKLRERR